MPLATPSLLVSVTFSSSAKETKPWSPYPKEKVFVSVSLKNVTEDSHKNKNVNFCGTLWWKKIDPKNKFMLYFFVLFRPLMGLENVGSEHSIGQGIKFEFLGDF